MKAENALVVCWLSLIFMSGVSLYQSNEIDEYKKLIAERSAVDKKLIEESNRCIKNNYALIGICGDVQSMLVNKEIK